MKLEHTFTPYTKVNSKRLKDLNKKKHHKAPKNIGKTFSDKSYQCFLRSVSQGNRNKSKNKQMGPKQIFKLLHSNGNHKQNEKTSHELG